MGWLDNLTGAAKAAGKAPQADAISRLADRVRQAGKLSADAESALDDALGLSGPQPLLDHDPPTPGASARVFGALERERATGTPDRSTSIMVTPRAMLTRWYKNTPGGFDEAVASSQEALAKYGIPYPHSNSPAYGRWSAEDVDTPIRVELAPHLPPTTAGVYGNNRIGIRPGMLDAKKARDTTLEHELTHHLLLNGSDAKSPLASQFQSNVRERFDGTVTGQPTLDIYKSLADEYLLGSTPEQRLAAENVLRGLVENEKYTMRRVELDPRIAEVRRRYAYHTGKDVTNLDEAEDAWDWYRLNRDHFEQIGGPLGMPSMTASQFDIYDSLPPASKQIMFTRMTQVPAIAAPIATGGVLSGLISGSQERQ